MLERLGGGHPGVDVVLLFFAKGEEKQIDLALELAGQRDLLFIEAPGSDGREGGLLGLLRVEGSQQTAHEGENQRWA
jgi:hypothetical protein